MIEVVGNNAGDNSHTLLTNTQKYPSEVLLLLGPEVLEAVKNRLHLYQRQLESLRIEVPSQKSIIPT